MRKKNRIWVLLLALVLCSALLPAGASAADARTSDTTKHTVTFIAGGEVFATVLVPDGDRLGNMPKVPEIEGGDPASSDLKQVASIDWLKANEVSQRPTALDQSPNQKFRCFSKSTLRLPHVSGGLPGSLSRAPEGYIPG